MGGLGPQVLLLLPLLPQFQGMREVGVVEGVERGGGHNPHPRLTASLFSANCTQRRSPGPLRASLPPNRHCLHHRPLHRRCPEVGEGGGVVRCPWLWRHSSARASGREVEVRGITSSSSRTCQSLDLGVFSPVAVTGDLDNAAKDTNVPVM